MGRTDQHALVRRSQRTKSKIVSTPYIFKGISSSDPKIGGKLTLAHREQTKSLERIKTRIATLELAKKDTKHLKLMQKLIEKRRDSLEQEIKDRNLIANKKADEDDIAEAKIRLAKIKAKRRTHFKSAAQKTQQRWEKHEVAAGISTPIGPCPHQVWKNKDIGDKGEEVDTAEVEDHYKGTDAIVLTQVKAKIDGHTETLRFDYIVIDSKSGAIVAIGETKTNTADFTKNQKIFHDDGQPVKIDLSDNPNLPPSLQGKTLVGDRNMVVMNRLIINDEK